MGLLRVCYGLVGDSHVGHLFDFEPLAEANVCNQFFFFKFQILILRKIAPFFKTNFKSLLF